MNKDSRIYVAGHRGLVGSAITEELEHRGFRNLLLRTHEELDLLDQHHVARFFESERPEYVFFAAAKVGGIGANSTYPADFIYQNVMMASNIISSSQRYGVKKLLNLGSSCIYPKLAPQPLQESALLTGPLEPTNRPYALAKIAALEMCDAFNRQYGTSFMSLMPTNLYGKNDTYDADNSHVIPTLILKFHRAFATGTDTVTLWGDGSPMREFLYSSDLAQAAVFVMENCVPEDLGGGSFINVGSGSEVSIKDLAFLIRDVVYEGVSGRSCEIIWDTSKPNGTPRKLLDSSRIYQLGWKPQTSFVNGLRSAYQNYLEMNRH